MSITTTKGPVACFARTSASSSSAMEVTCTAAAPMAAAWAAKSMLAGWAWTVWSSRLLNSAPPVAIWSRLMQPKPRLSVSTTVILTPMVTAVASSEFAIM